MMRAAVTCLLFVAALSSVPGTGAMQLSDAADDICPEPALLDPDYRSTLDVAGLLPNNAGVYQFTPTDPDETTGNAKSWGVLSIAGLCAVIEGIVSCYEDTGEAQRCIDEHA